MIQITFISDPREDQLHDIMELYRAEGWFSEGDTPALYRGMIRGSHCFAVALDGAKIIGMARAISDRANDAYVQDVTVLSTYRRRGIARMLVDGITARLRADGISWIGLVSANNTTPLYKKCGFKVMDNTCEPMLFEDRNQDEIHTDKSR